MKSTLSIDWLSFHGTFANIPPTGDYTIKQSEYGTKIFEEIYYYYFQGKQVATVTTKPRSTALHSDLSIIKFDNWCLYIPNLFDFVNYVLDMIGFETKGFSRLDLALDFNRFENGIDGHTLISQFVKDEYLHNGRGKFAISGVQKFTSTFEYLRLGSQSSPVRAYLYNKSTEMAEVKQKNYITDLWKQEGLDITKPVWRLEFSLTSGAFDWVEAETGECIIQKDVDYTKLSFLMPLYQACVNKYFDFRKNDGTKNKTRMPKVNLINLTKTAIIRNFPTLQTSTGRREKILLHSIYKFVQRYDIRDEDRQTEVDNVLSTLIRQTDLEDYFERKRGTWQNED